MSLAPDHRTDGKDRKPLRKIASLPIYVLRSTFSPIGIGGAEVQTGRTMPSRFTFLRSQASRLIDCSRGLNSGASARRGLLVMLTLAVTLLASLSLAVEQGGDEHLGGIDWRE